jgi:Dephospho-CoA kinase
VTGVQTCALPICMDETDARNRIASQISREDRRATATHVIDNSHGLDQLRVAVAELWADLLRRRDA